jgi:pyridoxal 5'-phosphate synthase pdxS subunit
MATAQYNNPAILADLSAGLGEPMVGINVSALTEKERLAGRGW